MGFFLLAFWGPYKAFRGKEGSTLLPGLQYHGGKRPWLVRSGTKFKCCTHRVENEQLKMGSSRGKPSVLKWKIMNQNTLVQQVMRWTLAVVTASRTDSALLVYYIYFSLLVVVHWAHQLLMVSHIYVHCIFIKIWMC